MSEFVKVIEHKSVPIRQLMTSANNERRTEQNFCQLFKPFMSCGRQNLALQGHRDDSTNFDTGDNAGNFQTLLDLCFKITLRMHQGTRPTILRQFRTK